jgi:nucleotide-binding universal stress UspA family protein
MRKLHTQLVLSRQGQRVGSAPRAPLADGDPGRLARGTILHPTDYSVASRHAFELACHIARECGSRLVVMHAAEPVRLSTSGMAHAPPLPKGYRGAWESRLSLIRPRDPAVAVEHLLEEGDVAEAILRVARDTESELIVMAGRQRTWLARLLSGSITGEVEGKAACPVLRLNSQGLGEGASTAAGESRGTDGVNPGGPSLPPAGCSEPARNAFEVARALARALGSERTVAHGAPS